MLRYASAATHHGVLTACNMTHASLCLPQTNLPTSWGDMLLLKDLMCQSCTLTGDLSWLANATYMPALKQINLADNHISGSLPPGEAADYANQSN